MILSLTRPSKLTVQGSFLDQNISKTKNKKLLLDRWMKKKEKEKEKKEPFKSGNWSSLVFESLTVEKKKNYS